MKQFACAHPLASLELWSSSDLIPHHNLNLYTIFPPNNAEHILRPKTWKHQRTEQKAEEDFFDSISLVPRYAEKCGVVTQGVTGRWKLCPALSVGTESVRSQQIIQGNWDSRAGERWKLLSYLLWRSGLLTFFWIWRRDLGHMQMK